ncbi:MAG TPA: 3-ketoacyl-ACP reductase [Candidatus Hydrogenedentes bacterium]|nr:3-ketoacyl-ACP reductase [Candidatus Hydrogenedentota bacterium]HPJ98031.1 3-ketoacyl-ACP reductase [Candidatus Hydrogenedentota bacterium]
MRRPVAMITGASRGIGRGIAIELAKNGFDLIGTATRLTPEDAEKGLFEVKARAEELGARFVPLAGDIGEMDDRNRLVDEAFAAFGRIDLLVNNAGVGLLKRLDILETTEESFDRLVRINLKGPFFLTQMIANRMIDRVTAGDGDPPSIIFITSISSNTASPNRAEYCISKAGLSMAAQTFAVRLAEFGINVYDIRPGIIATDMTAPVSEKYDKLISEGLLLQKRWGTPEDVGKAVASIAGGHFPYSTGAVIEVGGGFSVLRL